MWHGMFKIGRSEQNTMNINIDWEADRSIEICDTFFYVSKYFLFYKQFFAQLLHLVKFKTELYLQKLNV